MGVISTVSAVVVDMVELRKKKKKQRRGGSNRSSKRREAERF